MLLSGFLCTLCLSTSGQSITTKTKGPDWGPKSQGLLFFFF